MGACESANEKNNQKSNSKEPPAYLEKNKYYKIMDFEYEDKSSINSICESNSTKSNTDEISRNLKPQLAKYEPTNSLQKLRNSNTNRSCASSHMTDEEIIVQGEINLECQNKDEDFDNTSFKNLVQKEGGIVLVNRDFDTKSKTTSNISDIYPGLDSTKVTNKTKTTNVTKKNILSKKSNFNKESNLVKENNVNKINPLTKEKNVSKDSNLTKKNNTNNIFCVGNNFPSVDNICHGGNNNEYAARKLGNIEDFL